MLGICFQILSSDPRAYAFSFLSECWTAEYKDGDGIPRTEARLAPHRKECVICIASDGTEHRFMTWEMVRDNFGKVVALAEKHPLNFHSWIIDQLDKAIRLRNALGRSIPERVLKAAQAEMGIGLEKFEL